jgi:hypothetical protein
MDQEIAKMLAKGVVEVATHTPGEVMSNIFIRSKKDGSHRLILNLKDLNQFISYHHFKMDMLHSILKLIERGCFMALLDLKDAYNPVSVNHPDRKYLLHFVWQGVLYQFTCFPNRLSSCPWTFTKLLEMQQAPYIFQTLTYMEYCISN